MPVPVGVTVSVTVSVTVTVSVSVSVTVTAYATATAGVAYATPTPTADMPQFCGGYPYFSGKICITPYHSNIPHAKHRNNSRNTVLFLITRT